MNRSPDWEGYRALVAIADHGSFSRAAAALGISQPTVSRRVDDLERALAARLLIRRSRGAVPTPAGERVLTEARAMARSAGSAARLATGESAPRVRRIAISATEGLGTLWLPHRLAELERPDGLRIDVIIDNAPSDLSSRHADIAIRLFRPRQPDLVARRVGTLGFGLFASPAYLAARGTPRRLGDLARHDHIDFLDRGARPPPYLRWLRRIVPTDHFTSSASSLLAMHELARAGRGIVLGTTALLSGDRHLVRLLPRARPPVMDIWLAVHADVRRDPDVLRVVDTLEAIFQRESAALA